MRLTVVTLIASMCIALSVCAQAQADVSNPAPAPAASAYGSDQTMGRGPLSGAEGLDSTVGQGERQGLNAGLRFSQIVDSNVAGGASSGYAYSGAVSGQLGFHANSEHRRTMLSYDGSGMFHRTSQDPEQFHNFDFSEAFDVNRWSFLLATEIGYSSQGGTGVGVPGISNIGTVGGSGNLIPTLLPNQNILTFDSPRLSDTYVGQAQYQFSRRNSMTTVFSYGLMHFFNTSQMDSRQISGSVGFDRKLSALSTLALKYAYQHFSYNVLGPAMDSHSPQLMYERTFTPRLSGQVAVGPELVSFANVGSKGLQRQISVMASGSASLLYHMRDMSTSISYSRDVNGGSGLTNGARADTVTGSANRTFARQWHAGLTGGYSRTSAVAQAGTLNTRFAGGQLSRDLGRTMAISCSYTMQSQSEGTAPALAAAYNGIHHVFGISFDWHKEVPVR